MGAFVVKPLQEELAQSCKPEKPLADARRCLEVLVPLAYRPAIKVTHVLGLTIAVRSSLAAERSSMLHEAALCCTLSRSN